MKRYFLLTCFVFVCQSCFADSGWKLYTGGNLSTIFPNESHKKFGGMFGISRCVRSSENNISFGVEYVVKSVYLSERTMIFAMTEQGYHFDLLLSVSYLEFPFSLNFNLDLQNKIRLGFSVGPSLAIAIKDNSKSFNSRHFDFEYDQRDKIKYDYKESFDPGPFWLQSNSSFCYNVGFNIKYSVYFLEFIYNHSLNDLGTLAGLILNDEKFRTFELLLGVEIF